MYVSLNKNVYSNIYFIFLEISAKAAVLQPVWMIHLAHKSLQSQICFLLVCLYVGVMSENY